MRIVFEFQGDSGGETVRHSGFVRLSIFLISVSYKYFAQLVVLHSVLQITAPHQVNPYIVPPRNAPAVDPGGGIFELSQDYPTNPYQEETRC